MHKSLKTFDSLFDQLDEISSRLDHLLSLVGEKTTPPVSDQAPLLTTRQAAEFLGISPKTIYNYPERFQPVRLKQGGLRFRKVDLERLVA